MASIKTTHIDGDIAIGRNIAMGGKANVAGSVQVGHDLKVKGWLDAPNIKGANKGVFTSLEALEAAYPEPQDGWFAGVGASTPFTAYTGSNGAWVATGGTIDINVDMTQYSEDVEQLQQDVEQLQQDVLDRPEIIDLAAFDTTQPLPLGCAYYHNGLPTHSVAGTAYDSENEIFTDYIGICINHEDNSGFEPQHHDVMVFVKSSSNYIYSETFNTSEASGYLEEHVARALGSANATPSYSGLMSAEDKGMFDDMVTEVFPLTVAVASSNAGTREIGTEITPQIVLSITRKGANIPASQIELTISPTPASVSSDKRTITGYPVSSGTTSYQISVSQGGQTRSIPNQVFKFLNYVYGGELSSKPANSSAVKTQIESWGSSHGVLSDKKNSTAITSDGKIALSANKYYLFAVKQLTQNVPITLIVKNANSGGTIDVPSSDKGSDLVITRANHSGTDYYSWIIVPASSNSWNFQIVNS